jgi:peptide/nickel transport system permease protein
MSRIARRLLRDPILLIATLGLLVFVISAIFAPLLAPYPPNEANPMLAMGGIGTEGHLLGLDNQGRDMLSRLIYGSRMSLITGLVPVLIGSLITLPLGLVAAWYPLAGAVIMRLMEVLFAFPTVLLAILLTAFIGSGLDNLLLALVIILIPYQVRVVYVAALEEIKLPYVEAAKATATPVTSILFQEILPNVFQAAFAYSVTVIGSIVVAAAGLSFLGLGIKPPTSEWGVMTSEGRQFLFNAPHISTLPGLALTLLVISLSIVGDALQEAFEPKR